MCSGQCFEVQPRACEAHLHGNDTVWSGSEQTLAKAIRHAASLQNLSKHSGMEAKCAERILELFCKWAIPVCSVNDTPTQVCQSSCLSVVTECASLWLEARSIIKEMGTSYDCYDLLDTGECVTVTSGELCMHLKWVMSERGIGWRGQADIAALAAYNSTSYYNLALIVLPLPGGKHFTFYSMRVI